MLAVFDCVNYLVNSPNYVIYKNNVQPIAIAFHSELTQWQNRSSDVNAKIQPNEKRMPNAAKSMRECMYVEWRFRGVCACAYATAIMAQYL